jgi:membrane protease YdiL (CAAX protease family)
VQRWTTWADLAYTGLVTGLILSGRTGDAPLHGHDLAFATALSLNAGVGEEAFFRAWLLPLLHQNTGERFWLSNSLQAALFGLVHVPQAGELAVVIAGWALYEGWLTRRNEWSVRESIFHHFWYDVAVVVASFLADETEPRIQLTLPTIRF